MKLPPSWPYNHAIELKGLFILQQAKAYPLNPTKHQAHKEFVKEHLKTGKFPLQNPLRPHCSSSSKRRKLGNYAPAKTTSISTAILSRTLIPSPLSLTLSTNYEDHQSSPSSIYSGDITISSSNWRTARRQPSPPHLGYSNQMSYSSECATHQPLSRPSWMTSLEITS